jgi:glucokinase
MCELVDTHGEIVSSYRVNWSSSAIRLALGFGGRIVIEADVRAAAIAEAVHGAGAGLRHWIYANVGTGVSTAVMNGATPYLGCYGRGLAFGMGPATFVADDPSVASIEEMSGAAGMLRRARAKGLSVDRFSELVDLAGTGHPEAIRIVEDGGKVLGRALGFLANTLDPEAIVLGGGVALAMIGYTTPCNEVFRKAVWYKEAGIPEIRLARLGSDSGLIGAAMAAAR